MDGTHTSLRIALRFPFLCVAVLLTLIFAPRARAAELTDAQLQNRRCLECHGQAHIGELTAAERRQMVASTGAPATAPAARPELFIQDNPLAQSVHANIPCISCHPDARNLPHNQHLAAPTCDTTCHAKENSAYLHSSHAEALAKGNAAAPRCYDCHGTHDIRPKTDRASKIFPLNVVTTCGNCHEKHTGKDTDGTTSSMKVTSYLESVHGKALRGAGLAVSATCADCHGSHDIRPSTDPASSVNRANVPETCASNGRCHVGITEVFAKSVHGELLAGGNKNAPACTDCHTAHAISRADVPAFQQDIVAECGHCHDKPAPGSREKASLYETYRESYHGQVTALGSARAAKCSDCHGAHDITRVNAANSPLNAQNKIDTCRKCHAQADVKFASFAPHADFRNSARYPALHYVFLYFAIMMSASFGFFGLHCLLWAFRGGIERLRHGPHKKPDYSKGAIRRFTRVDRINHGFVIVTFFGLALTGLPLLYSDKSWARVLAGLFGGARSCGILHRIFAVMLIGNFVVHGFGVARRLLKAGPVKLLLGPTTMLPTKKDLRDCLGMFRWFFVGGHKPKFDRWTYWEKFDYMAEVGGSGIIGLSGLMLWFPVYFSRYLPGWLFNVAMMVHGFEALLAVGFIFTIHFFNAHLRFEKFPVDDVMFTGRMTEAEFAEERAAEYARLVKTGEIAALRVPAPRAWYRKFSVAMGILAMLVGTTIVLLIILAALRIV